jgi:2,4-dienoyl-CoA reductase-like NADH-dependent reductase (Old Yellow Enzyme family)
VDGHASDWHLVHLGSRAVGGAGLVFTEATAVLPEARISPEDLGIWSDEHIGFLSRITKFLHSQGAASGIQLAHAGRKGSTWSPFSGKEGAIPIDQGGWEPVAPSAIKFAPNYPQPRALTVQEIKRAIQGFEQAAKRAIQAGFRVVEIHSAHGYLIHEFLSPFSNQRTDNYGGSFENRTRLLREVVTAVRGVIPDSTPLFVRISSTDWKEGGWDIEQSVELARALKPLGVDLIDCSSGGNIPDAKIPIGAGYQVPFSERVRRDAEILTGAVGMITEPRQADEIISSGKADIVLIAREFLRDPYLPLHAAQALDRDTTWPAQYLRASTRKTQQRRPLE